MREYKFKCWFPKTKRMTEVFILGQLIEQIENTKQEENGFYLQFTGLKDKNGIEGYYKDIWFDGLNNYIVEWIDKIASFKLKGIKINYEYSMAHFREGEIVGNIFDNPELLEGEK